MASEVESKVSAFEVMKKNAPYIAGTCWYKYKHIYILYIIHIEIYEGIICICINCIRIV